MDSPASEMKRLNETEDATTDKKLFKSQMERRRRERMNHSLERLRGLLLQEPQQPCGDQRRAEKAEVLERTVLFLQRFKIQDSTLSSAEGPRSSRDGATAGGHSFQDGFSTCLERATHFLGPRGKGLLQTAVNLDTTLALRLSRSDYVSSVTKRPMVSSPAARRPKHARTTSSALDVCGLSFSLSKRLPVRREGRARVSERTRGAAGPVAVRTHQTYTVSPPPSPASAFQSLLWRPWP